MGQLLITPVYAALLGLVFLLLSIQAWGGAGYWRSIHAVGVSQTKKDYRLRVTGVALTLSMVSISCLLILARAVTRISAA